MKRLFICLLALPLLVLFAACGSSVSAGGFDTSCATDKDCVAVFIGDFCANPHCNCPNDAINVSSKAAWEADAQTKIASCGSSSGPACSCANHVVTCEAGTCAIN